MIPNHINHYLAVVHPDTLWIRHSGMKPVRDLVRHFKDRGCEGLEPIQVIELHPSLNGGEHYGLVVDGIKRAVAARETDHFLIAEVYNPNAVANIPSARLTMFGYISRRRMAKEMAKKKPDKQLVLF